MYSPALYTGARVYVRLAVESGRARSRYTFSIEIMPAVAASEKSQLVQ